MFYDASKEFDRHRAFDKLNFLISKSAIIEIKEKRQKRSISQNSYMHLLFAWFAIQTGYTADEVKQFIFKQVVNSSLFDDGEFDGLIKIQRWRSVADLSKEETTLAIDRFRNWSSSEAGIYLPEPKDLVLLQQIEMEIENHKQYL